MAPTILAETPVPLFLMSVAKPLVTIAAFVPYAALVSGKLEKDAGYYNLKPQRWAAIFLAFGAAALLASILIPTWFAGFPVMVALMVAPCAWYMSFRNKALAGTKAKPLSFLNVDFAKMSAERRARAARAARRTSGLLQYARISSTTSGSISRAGSEGKGQLFRPFRIADAHV